MAVAEEPILSRLDRLDIMLRRLEQMKGSSGRWPRSSGPSTPSSSGQGSWSLEGSPKSIEKQCRPIHRVMVETEIKGTLLHRLSQAEDRILKLCLQLEEELEAEEKREEEEKQQHPKKKGIKKLVHKVVREGSKKHRPL